MTRLLAALLALAALPLSAQEFETAARAAWVYDDTTGTVLLEKNADQPLPPASMSKLMTLYMAFDAIERGQLALDQTLPVSEHAMSYGGSSMFLNTLDRPTVHDLLRGVIVLSGNDATVVLAEALSPDGTETGFAALMTEKARELGMTDSHFVNSNGWPAAGQVMSAHDLGVLAEHLIEDFPEFYPIFSEQEFEFDGRVPSNSQNRNPILGLGIGADGLKTGHTEEAGYGLVGSAKQGDRRVIFVVTGLPSTEARRTESERIINWAFRQFAVREVGTAGTRLAEAEVWMGAAPRVGLVLPADLSVLVPALGDDAVHASISYEGPLAAPIAQGQEVAELVLTREGLPEMRLPLVAEAEVPKGGFVPRVGTALRVLMGKAGLTAIPVLAPATEEPATEPASTGPAPSEPAPAEPASDEPAAPASEPAPASPGGETLQDGD
ncbi:D-alanyl-D-alanine carboxypeptidase family protein [Rubellimicrobium aerolatum]|uniref:serine-type D-Ala-D-Ala carboxypeptidase n=1 Tax=Rubellimicrobium aerolatum TaxID=490979 RepID=A0ABW0SCE1_9RHOB|nr:D-alanyl-D-alanine carboxypeptidase family protein [Rubellimicrobium aerolatum]MBP1806366.1 D-alanyl-D-alanine carboxypeptidase (penicillin-binding protein 5/6) [Rubellimicrobium aerolatum]